MKAFDQSNTYKMNGRPELRTPGDWLVEPKYDGVRVLANIEDGRVTLISYNSHINIGRAEHLDLSEPVNVVLDGELFMPDGSLGDVVSITNSSHKRGLVDCRLAAFDILSVAGKKTTDLPLVDRKSLLHRIASAMPKSMIIPPEFTVDDIELLRSEFEGVMLKRKKSKYRDSQSRTKDWIKIKWIQTLDCFVIGHNPGSNGLVGSLKMGVFDDDGKVVEVGSHGVFDAQMRTELTAEDGGLADGWLGTVMEVAYQAHGTEARMRHPRLVRLRPDKSPQDCNINQFHGEARKAAV